MVTCYQLVSTIIIYISSFVKNFTNRYYIYKNNFTTSLVKEDINNSICLHQMVDAKRIHYNFCKEHSKFKKTPSEQAGIKMDIQNNRIETLFKLSALKKTNSYKRKSS